MKLLRNLINGSLFVSMVALHAADSSTNPVAKLPMDHAGIDQVKMPAKTNPYTGSSKPRLRYTVPLVDRDIYLVLTCNDKRYLADREHVANCFSYYVW